MTMDDAAANANKAENMAQSVAPEQELPKKLIVRARHALRGDEASLSWFLKHDLPGLALTDPLWQDLQTPNPPSRVNTADERLAGCLALLLEGNRSNALRQLIQLAPGQTDGPDHLAIWTLLRNAMSSLDAPHQPALDKLCRWALRNEISRNRPNLRRRALEWLVLANPLDSALAWELVRHLAIKGENEALRPVFDRLMKTDDIPDLADRRLMALLAALPVDQLLAHFARMRRTAWVGLRQKLLNLAARRVKVAPDTLRRPLLVKSDALYYTTQDGGAGVTAIVFSGVARNPGAPLVTFDQVLAQRGIRAIYIFNDKGTAYITGAAAQPTAQATFAFLQRLLDETPDNKVITIGNSMAAIGACAYGLNMRVDGVLCYAGATTGLASERALIGDKGGEEMAQMAEMLGGIETDLRTWFDRISHRPKVHMHFAEGSKLDRRHAERIAGYEGVTLIEATGHTEHTLPAEMILRDTLGATIDRMLADL